MSAAARLLQLSRIRELATNTGQYAVAVLLLAELDLAALVGLCAVTAAGLFAFAYNSRLEARRGRMLELKGHAPLELTRGDRRAILVFVWAGLVGAVGGIALLWAGWGVGWGGAMIACYLFIGYAYSSPRLFLKGVAGAECAANGLAHALPFLAGYLQFRDLDRFSACYAVASFLFLAAFYLLHCLEDHEHDRSQGIKNLCHYLGPRRTPRAAMVLIALSALPFGAAAFEHPVIAPFLAFFPVALVEARRLDRTGDLSHVARIRRYGRGLGALMFGVVLAHALWRMSMVSAG